MLGRRRRRSRSPARPPRIALAGGRGARAHGHLLDTRSMVAGTLEIASLPAQVPVFGELTLGGRLLVRDPSALARHA